MSNVHRLSSTGVLTAKRRKPQTSEALLIGGLDYNYLNEEEFPISKSLSQPFPISGKESISTLFFRPLPGSRKEVDSIAPFITHATTKYYESEEQLKHQFAAFDLVHFSTHGYSLEVAVPSPNEITGDSITADLTLHNAGFALSGANITHYFPHREDGLLTACELSELDLRSVRYVVACACQTAQGTIQDEGAAGVLRGLKMAGAGTVLATLWPVDDNASTRFMQTFYRTWNNGRGTDGKGCSMTQALLAAQQQLRIPYTLPANTNNSVQAKVKNQKAQTVNHSAPYFWAPFILIDDL